MNRGFSSYPELFLAILCFFSILFLRRLLLRRNDHIPLTNWPIVGMLPGLLINLHRLHRFGTDLLAASGHTFRFLGPCFSGMDFLITCHPSNVDHVFNSNFQNYPKGAQFTELFDILGDGIFNADDQSWRIQRKKAQLLMSKPEFRAFSNHFIRDKVSGDLLPLLRQFSEEGIPVDLQDVFLRLSFDITCKLVFGVDPASLSREFPVVPFAKAMDDAMSAILRRHVVPVSWWKLMRRLQLGGEKKLGDARRVIDEFISESIEKTRTARGCADESLVTAYFKDGGDAKFIRDTTLSFMLAGRDTVGVALSWFFYLLCRNPMEEGKVVDEVRTAGTGGVYLHAALCEALRLYPPVPFEVKEAAGEDELPSGERVEKGMKLFFSPYSMGRMEGVWGEDCLEYRPERWVTERGRLRHQPSYKFMSFNCGPRTCLGKELAFSLLKEVVAAVVREYRVEIVEEHVVEPKISIILQMRNGLLVRVGRRQE